MPIVIEQLDIQVQDAPPVVPPAASEDVADVFTALLRESQMAQRRERQVVD
jgi:hypothetical protein